LKGCSAILKKGKVGNTKSGTNKKKKGSCFWFTGPSGTGVRSALNKLKDAFADRERAAEIISIEDELLPVFAKYTRPSDTSKEKAFLADLHKTGGFKQILNESPKVVSEFWHTAAENAARKARKFIDNGTHVFLTFHAVYHADKFGDFYSPIDPVLLQQFPSPKKFLCLIDDIGDVASRLRGPGQVFSNRSLTGINSVIEAIRDLLTVLEWRATELTVSRLLASLMHAEIFVLAVKHPLLTAVRVLLGAGTPAYISHSISEPRRILERAGSWPSFMNEVQRFTNTLAKLETEQVSGLVPICPTSIDERRIATRRTVSGTELLVPMLTPRWDFAETDVLVSAPSVSNPLDPCEYFNAAKISQNPVPADIESELQAVNGLLQALRTRIDNQINARDHTLVSQCPFFIVYRPYEAWRVTGGVVAEIRHRERLKAEGKSEGKTIFLHSSGDDNRRKLRIAAEEAGTLFRWIQGANELVADKIVDLLMVEFPKNPPASFQPKDLKQSISTILAAQGVKFGGPGATSGAEVLGKVTSAETDAEVERLWQRISEDATRKDPWKSSSDEWIVKDLSPEAFAVIAIKLNKKMK
jgi:hypothetical protein